MDRSGLKILLLDDEPFILKLHARVLSEMGFSDHRAFLEGSLALAHIDEGGMAPDLVLLDLSMPEMDGIQFIRQLVKRDFRGGLILLSGEDERLLRGAERLVLAHGIDLLGHLSKPVDPGRLAGLIDGWRGRPGEARPAERVYSPVEIDRAISNREIVNRYQPKVSVQTGEIQGVEALARWEHPQAGLVPPSEFIALAEEHGLIERMTRLVLTNAVTEIKALSDLGPSLSVAVNLAAPLLSSLDFADFAAREVAQAGLSPKAVTLEVTESRLMGDDIRIPFDVLTRLRLMRFKLSIDDFGTGYSSLAQLRDIPFDELKIDRIFVNRASTDSIARAMYDASLGLAKQLEMTAVAEGVEDRADWDHVRATACDTAQGFFIGRPMAADALPSWALEWRARAAELNLG